jgi:uncharacterized membrane protein YdjX (TVP38/TMEM64 family)
MMKYLQRFWPVILLGTLLALFFYFRLDRYLSFESLKSNRALLLSWTEQHHATSLLTFALIYMLAVAISIPGAWFLTLTAGFLFGPISGTLLVICSATLGAFVVYLAVKYTLRDWVAKKTTRWLKTMEQGFQDNAFSYLLFLRLVPLFPFWLVNIVPALLGIAPRTYLTATFIGIIPGSFVYVLVGNGLGHVFDANQTPNLAILKDPVVLFPLIALGLLALVPIIYRKVKKS